MYRHFYVCMLTKVRTYFDAEGGYIMYSLESEYCWDTPYYGTFTYINPYMESFSIISPYYLYVLS